MESSTPARSNDQQSKGRGLSGFLNQLRSKQLSRGIGHGEQYGTSKEIFDFVTKFNVALGNNPFNASNGAKNFTSDREYKDLIEKYRMSNNSVSRFEETIHRHPEAISFEQFVAAVGEKLVFSPDCVARSKGNLQLFKSSKK